ncbi:hypothetical protein [Pseudomonas sp. H1_D05]
MIVRVYNPADIFVELWINCACQLPSKIATAAKPNPAFAKSIRSALGYDDGQKSYDAIHRLLSNIPSGLSLGAQLIVMDEIDRVFSLIHPRNLNAAGGHVLTSKIPRWLKALKITRLGGSAYAFLEDHNLIARGPLSRIPRGETASSAICFADRFSALTVVPLKLKLNTVPINVKYEVKAGAADGASPGGKLGSEQITFIPIAIKNQDLKITERNLSGNIFVKYEASPTIDVPDKVMKALKGAGFSDIAIAPELICSEHDADRISELLKEDSGSHRLLVSGSGSTIDSQGGSTGTKPKS